MDNMGVGDMDSVLEIKKDEQAGVYVARFKLPVIYSQGRTFTEANIAIESAVKLWLEEFFKK
ncbi:hypothetical protein LCGC14_1554600 [marine sediment metagenome]|uniref:HicB-like antitoxin of toxin-antitoxin system domain-containing protein n=1 Tax=marine sediment metagenome TaxID=412755 RepID=A0A0F9IPA4_9ZZZZ